MSIHSKGSPHPTAWRPLDQRHAAPQSMLHCLQLALAQGTAARVDRYMYIHTHVCMHAFVLVRLFVSQSPVFVSVCLKYVSMYDSMNV